MRKGTYIVEVSCQLLNVLLQLICCLQAILEETEEKDTCELQHSNTDQPFTGSVTCAAVQSCWPF